MTLKEQLYVCTLARCQTITKASEELCISQPALSTYISNLEKVLGARLFQRTGKMFLLTPIGEEYVKRALVMLELKEEFDQILNDATGKDKKVLKVGVQQRRAIAMAPFVLSRFAEHYPNINLSFKDGAHDELVQMYQNDSVDMIIYIAREQLPDTEHLELCQEPVLIALHKDHPAVENAWEVPGDPFLHLNPECLDKEAFILPLKDQSLRMTADGILEQYRVRPRIVKEISNFETIMAMVNENLGIGFNRLGYLSTMNRFPYVRYFLVGSIPYTSPLVLAYHKGLHFTPYMDYFMQLVQNSVTSLFKAGANI